MSTLVGHFVSPPREREKRDRRDIRGGERGIGKKEGNKRKGSSNNIPHLHLPAARTAGFAQL